MFIKEFNPSVLTAVIAFPTKRFNDYYSESLSDFLYQHFIPLHKDNLDALYVGNEDSRFSEIADEVRCEIKLDKLSNTLVEIIYKDLCKFSEEWLLCVGGYDEVKP